MTFQSVGNELLMADMLIGLGLGVFVIWEHLVFYVNSPLMSRDAFGLLTVNRFGGDS